MSIYDKNGIEDFGEGMGPRLVEVKVRINRDRLENEDLYYLIGEIRQPYLEFAIGSKVLLPKRSTSTLLAVAQREVGEFIVMASLMKNLTYNQESQHDDKRCPLYTCRIDSKSIRRYERMELI